MIWTTLSRDQIPYGELTDAHLRNIIRMLRRKAKETKRAQLAWFEKMAEKWAPSYYDKDNPTSLAMTDNAADLEATSLEDYAKQLFPDYQALMDEIKARGLDMGRELNPGA
jgi:hypothetical protein